MMLTCVTCCVTAIPYLGAVIHAARVRVLSRLLPVLLGAARALGLPRTGAPAGPGPPTINGACHGEQSVEAGELAARGGSLSAAIDPGERQHAARVHR